VDDAGISATQWHASTCPAAFHPKINVVHNGIDIGALFGACALPTLLLHTPTLSAQMRNSGGSKGDLVRLALDTS
jgi:hypothetical protein